MVIDDAWFEQLDAALIEIDRVGSNEAGDGGNRYRIGLERRRGVDFLVISGTVLELPATRFSGRLLEVMARRERSGVVIDLCGCDFLCSSAFGLLASFFASARAAGGEVVTLAPGGRVRAMLATMRLEQHFAVVDDETAARRLLAERGLLAPSLIEPPSDQLPPLA